MTKGQEQDRANADVNGTESTRHASVVSSDTARISFHLTQMDYAIVVMNRLRKPNGMQRKIDLNANAAVFL